VLVNAIIYVVLNLPLTLLTARPIHGFAIE
jgi:hypothetical protein